MAVVVCSRSGRAKANNRCSRGLGSPRELRSYVLPSPALRPVHHDRQRRGDWRLQDRVGQKPLPVSSYRVRREGDDGRAA